MQNIAKYATLSSGYVPRYVDCFPSGQLDTTPYQATVPKQVDLMMFCSGRPSLSLSLFLKVDKLLSFTLTSPLIQVNNGQPLWPMKMCGHLLGCVRDMKIDRMHCLVVYIYLYNIFHSVECDQPVPDTQCFYGHRLTGVGISLTNAEPLILSLVPDRNKIRSLSSPAPLKMQSTICRPPSRRLMQGGIELFFLRTTRSFQERHMNADAAPDCCEHENADAKMNKERWK